MNERLTSLLPASTLSQPGDTTMSVETSLRRLRDARNAYDRSVKAVDDARREETDRRNALNEAQRSVDAEMNKLRGEAPTETEWKTRRGQEITHLMVG